MSNGTPARAALALLIAGVASTLVLVSMPVFVAAIATTFGWGDREVGWLASADMTGSALAGIATIPLIGRVRWRLAAGIAIAALIAGNALSALANSFATILSARALAGAGSGVLLSIAYVGLCRAAQPDRYFGLYVFAQLTLQILALAALPMVLTTYGLDAIFLLFASVAAMTAALVPHFPPVLPAAPEASASAGSLRNALSAPALTALFAQGLYFLAPGATWGYLERIGQSFGLSLPQIGVALGASTVAGIVGALLVVGLGTRLSRWPALLGGSTISVLSVLLLAQGTGFTHFLVAASLFNFAWNATFPYQMGVLASLDRTGVVAILSLLVQLVGLALGPLVASLLHPDEGYRGILLGCVGCYLVSLALFRTCIRQHG